MGSNCTREGTCVPLDGGHQVNMTNVERHRRHMGATRVCQFCRGREETILHVLRDCPSIAGIWERVVPRRWRQDFFAGPLLGWLYGNLGRNDEVDGCSWSTLFAMGVW